MENNFYITLPSNSATRKENTVAEYITKLPKHISLDGKWEVALAEISYTKSWYNLTSDQYIGIVYYFFGSDQMVYTDWVRLPKGYYNTIEDILNKINTQIAFYDPNNEWTDPPSVSVNELNRKVTIKWGKFNDMRILLELGEEICNILGIDWIALGMGNAKIWNEYKLRDAGRDYELPDKLQSDYPQKEEWQDLMLEKYQYFQAEQPYDISAGLHSLFVYCNIVQPTFVGNAYDQLLRIVEIPTDAKFGHQIQHHYSNLYYTPLLTHEFETIEIGLNSERGEKMPFEFGRSIVVLHFRQISL